MVTFEIGNKYFCNSIYDRRTVWTFEVIKRTVNSITIKDVETGETTNRRIDKKGAERFGYEFVHPFGKNGGVTLSADKGCRIGR